MQIEPHLERIGAALADISRKRMLCALMSGRAHTGKELALCAGVSASTATGHLARLRAGGLITSLKSGRTTYHQLAGPDVAAALEGLAALVPASFSARLRAAQKGDPGCLVARCCYDHLAGSLGVGLCKALVERHAIVVDDGFVRAGAASSVLAMVAGITPEPGAVIGRTCLDWSERQLHLSGDLGRSMLARWLAEGWLKPGPQARALTPSGAGWDMLGQLGLPDGSATTIAMARNGGRASC